MANEKCDGKMIPDPQSAVGNKYCIWSAHPDDVQEKVTRKGLCDNKTDCITSVGKCYEYGEAGQTFVCGQNNEWFYSQGANQ